MIRPIAFFIGLIVLIGLTAAWIGILVATIFSYPFLQYITPHSLLTVLATVNILTIIGIPLLSLILLSSRIFFGANILLRWKTGLWAFWIINVVSFFVAGSFSARQFSQGNNQLIAERDIAAIDTLFIQAEPPAYEGGFFFDSDHLQLGHDQLIVKSVMLQIQQSKEDQFRIVQEHYSRGRNLDHAVQLANNIRFEYTLEGNTLSFPDHIILKKGEKWRNQEVRLIVYVPEGKTIFLQPSALKGGALRRIDIDRDIEHPYPYSDRFWKMTEDGLICEHWINRNNEVHPLNYSDFDRLQIEGPLSVSIEQGDNFQVMLTGRKKYVDRVEVEQLGRTLNLIYGDDAFMQLRITMPSLISFDADNTEKVRISGFQEENLFLRYKGRHELDALLEVDKLTLVQEGDHRLILRGVGRELDASLKEGAELEADGFRVNTATVFTRGYSQAELMVADTLRRKTDRLQSIELTGNPVIIDLK